MTGEFYKNLLELDAGELEKVWANNKGVRERVFSHGMESAYFVVDEYVHGLPRGCADYSIGDQGDYFRVKDAEPFLEWLREVQEYFCLLPENEEWSPYPLIEKAEILSQRMDFLYCELSDENYSRMESRRDEIIEELAGKVQKVLSGEYEYFYSDENCLEYFLGNLEIIFGDGYWIDDTFALWHVYTVKECFV